MIDEKHIILPDGISTKAQLMKLIHEVEKLQDQALQGHIRKDKTGKEFVVDQPSPSLQLLLESMGRKLTLEALREAQAFLIEIRKTAPTVRIVFSSEPDHEITMKVVRWFRRESNAPVLLRIGVQPSIAGGCIVFTPTHRYDFTLRHQLLAGTTKISDVIGRIK